MTEQSGITTIIFDLDGTLIDTEPSASEAVRECFADWGIAVDSTDASYVTGRTWASAFDFLFSKYRAPLPRAQAVHKIMEKYREILDTRLHVVPGSAEAVRALAPHFRLGLVSGSGRAEILWALDKLGIRDHFQTILGAEDYPLSKPAPDGYLRAIRELACAPRCGLVFEDSHPGIASARAAGLWVVAITGTNHFNQDTSAAHHHIPDLTPVNHQWVSRLKFRVSE